MPNVTNNSGVATYVLYSKIYQGFLAHKNSSPDGDHYVFNPSVEKLKINLSSTPELPVHKIIGRCVMGSDGHFYYNNNENANPSNIYIYKIYGLAESFYINTQALSWLDKDSYAIAFFDAGLLEESFVLNQEYYCHHLGCRTHKEMNLLKNEDPKSNKSSNWFTIPRELFTSVKDYVYLAICAKTDPKPKVFYYPLNRPFYWELPVMTSVIDAEGEQKPDILLGTVKYVERSNGLKIRGKDIKPLDEKILSEIRKSIIPGLGISVNNIKEYNLPCTFRSKDVDMCCHESYYMQKYISEVSVKLIIPKMANAPIRLYNLEIDTLDLRYNLYLNTNEVRAFVWNSGNDDDLERKGICSVDYLDANSGPLMNSLSMKSIYGSYISLKKISPKVAARYLVRSLADQPKGARCLSIEGMMDYLMGGALYKITDKIGFLSPKEKMKWIASLLCYNGSLLFYDSPMTYSHPEQFERILRDGTDDESNYQVRLYLHEVLGIEEGSNGCKRIKEDFLTPLFEEIKNLGIQLDYVYCDIERIWNDARMLFVNRFSDRFLMHLLVEDSKSQLSSELKSIIQSVFELVPEDKIESAIASKLASKKELQSELDSALHDLRDCIYNTLLSREISQKKNGDILNQLQSRGYCPADVNKYLDDISSSVPHDDPDKETGCRYGIVAGDFSYVQRCNFNIWDAVMKNYENSLFRDYVFQPVWNAFPKAICSAMGRCDAKGYINCADRYETYLGGNVVLGDERWYSCCGLYDNYYSKGTKKLWMDNWKMLPKVTPFSYFMDHFMRLRSAYLSSGHRLAPFITSWNIWAKELNQELSFYPEDQSVTELAKAYYKELIIHTLMCSRDKAIAYFNTEESICNEPYYINLNQDGNYYGEAYRALADIIGEMNYYVGTDSPDDSPENKISNAVPLSYMANPPFALTVAKGMETNTKVWRITFNQLTEYKKDKTDESRVMFEVDGVHVEFDKVKKDVFMSPETPSVGFWVVTDWEGRPNVQFDLDYYHDHPAYQVTVFDKTNTEQVYYDGSNQTLVLKRLNNYTLFGEMPKNQAVSMKFKLKGLLNDPYYLLMWYGNAAVIKREKGILVTLRSNGKRNEIQFGNEDKCVLELNKTYELRLYYKNIKKRVTELAGNQVDVAYDFKVKYELWDSLGPLMGVETPISHHEYNESFKKSQFFLSELTLVLNHNHPIERDKLIIEDARLFFTGKNYKVDFYRASDGVNVSRINRLTQEYSSLKNLKISTKKGTPLIGKLSTLSCERGDLVNYIEGVLDVRLLDEFADGAYNAQDHIYSFCDYVAPGREENVFFYVDPIPTVNIVKSSIQEDGSETTVEVASVPLDD